MNPFSFFSASISWSFPRKAFLSSLLLLALAPSALPAAENRPAVLVISIDGLRPDYITQADKHGLKIPHLRRMLSEGTYATAVRGVLPTSTYPSHTTLVTGVSPGKHGVFSNKPFGSYVKGLDVWYCYSDDVKVPTLWQAASAAGVVTASLSWPVTVGAQGIRYNIAEFNLTRTDEDIKITRGVSTSGLMAELEPKAGTYITDADKAVARDWARTRYAVELITRKHPGFFTVHVAATDHEQHAKGPFVPVVYEALEEIDAMVGQMWEAMKAEDPHAVLCIVSDHGFSAVENVLYLDAALLKAGFITLKKRGTNIDDSVVSDWVAQSWLNGGSAGIVLKNPQDQAARAKVKALLDDLAADPANGIASVLDEAAIKQWGGTSTAQFWVDMKPGFTTSGTLNAAMVSHVSTRGTHGYSPVHAEMASSFFIMGGEIPRGKNLGAIDMRSIAPTLAKLMSVPFPSADLPALDFSATLAK